MDRKNTLEELRKLLRDVIKHSPKEDRETVEKRLTETIRHHCAIHVQTVVIELTKDLGMNELSTMVEIIPDIASDLLRGVALNVLANTPEDKIEESGKLVDNMVKEVVSQLKVNDYRSAWKDIQKELLEMTIKGKAGTLKI